MSFQFHYSFTSILKYTTLVGDCRGLCFICQCNEDYHIKRIVKNEFKLLRGRLQLASRVAGT